MTDDMMTPRTLGTMTTDAGLLRDMVGSAAEKPMEMEVGAAIGAAWGERGPLRTARRNGYRERRARHGLLCQRQKTSHAPRPRCPTQVAASRGGRDGAGPRQFLRQGATVEAYGVLERGKTSPP